MSSFLKQCTIRTVTVAPNVEEKVINIKNMYWILLRNAAKISFVNFIISFCKMVTVATEKYCKGSSLLIHLGVWQVVDSLFFFFWANEQLH